jgi:hypothetical protein
MPDVFTYHATRLPGGHALLKAERPHVLALPDYLDAGEDSLMHPSLASAFAKAQEHAREHGQTILPADLIVSDYEDGDWDDDNDDDEDEEV